MYLHLIHDRNKLEHKLGKPQDSHEIQYSHTTIPSRVNTEF